MSTIQEIEEAIGKLSPKEVEELLRWIGRHVDDDWEKPTFHLTDKAKAGVATAREQIRLGQFRTRQP